MAISIIIADDHPVVRMGLRLLLDREKAFQVIGEAADGIETVKLVREKPPQVLILDLMMPGMTGMQVVEKVKQDSPGTRIIILSMHSDRSYISEAMRKGADGYVVKDSLADQIVQAVQAVSAGNTFFPAPASDRISGMDRVQDRSLADDHYELLTAREREILAHIAQGRTNKEIADQLVISVRTVETHRARIMRKLDLQSHAALIHYATRKLPLFQPS